MGSVIKAKTGAALRLLGIGMPIPYVRKNNIPVWTSIVCRRSKTSNGIFIVTDIFKHDILQDSTISLRWRQADREKVADSHVVVLHGLSDVCHNLDRLAVGTIQRSFSIVEVSQHGHPHHSYLELRWLPAAI